MTNPTTDKDQPVNIEDQWEAGWLVPQHPDYRWIAYRGDMDLGITVGHGTTPLEAVADLFMQED